jgi:hypothetical protein
MSEEEEEVVVDKGGSRKNTKWKVSDFDLMLNLLSKSTDAGVSDLKIEFAKKGITKPDSTTKKYLADFKKDCVTHYNYWLKEMQENANVRSNSTTSQSTCNEALNLAQQRVRESSEQLKKLYGFKDDDLGRIRDLGKIYVDKSDAAQRRKEEKTRKAVESIGAEKKIINAATTTRSGIPGGILSVPMAGGENNADYEEEEEEVEETSGRPSSSSTSVGTSSAKKKKHKSFTEMSSETELDRQAFSETIVGGISSGVETALVGYAKLQAESEDRKEKFLREINEKAREERMEKEEKDREHQLKMMEMLTKLIHKN